MTRADRAAGGGHRAAPSRPRRRRWGPGRAPAALLALALFAAAPPAHRIAGVPYVEQDRGPWCAAATVAMVARHRGATVDLRSLVREVPVAADGIAWLDLAAALRPAGLEILTITTDEAGLRLAIAAGQPMIVSVREGGGKHAVVVTGYDDAVYDILDPAAPGVRRLPRAALRARWARGQAVVVRRADAPPRGLPLARWRRQDRRYRALEWGLRAERQAAPEARLALYTRAVAADASIAEIHNNLAIALAEVGRRAEACRHLARAARLKPRWPVPADNRRKLRCPSER